MTTTNRSPPRPTLPGQRPRPEPDRLRRHAARAGASAAARPATAIEVLRPRSSWRQPHRDGRRLARTSPTNDPGGALPVRRPCAHRDQGRVGPRRAGGWLPPTHLIAARASVRQPPPLRRAHVVDLRILAGIDAARRFRTRDPRVRGTRRTAAAGPDPAPRPEHGQPRPAGRGAADRRWCAYRTSTTSPTGRTRRCSRQRPSSASRTCRTSRWAAFAAAVRRAGVGRQAAGATPTAVAQSWLLQHSPNIMLIRHLVGRPPTREHRRRGPDPARRRHRRAGRDLSSGRPPKGVVPAGLLVPPSAEGGDRNGNRATDAVHNRRKPS